MQPKDYETLARLLGGELSGQNERKARESLLADPGKKLVFEALSKYWKMMDAPAGKSRVNTDKAWEKLNSRMRTDGLLPVKTGSRKHHFLPSWMKYAASLLLLAIAGSLIYIALRDKPDQEFFASNTSTESQTLVQFLTDGTVVYLAENTRLSYPESFDPKQRRVSLEGEAYFEVTGKQDQPFMIETQSATIQVLGTSFNVKSTGEDQFELYVHEGLVSVNPRRKGRSGITVGAGEKVTYASGRFEKHSEAHPESASWWMHRMHFKDETLENILTVVSRNFGAGLEAAPEVSKRRLTVTFYQNTVPTIIELICLSMNLEVEETKDSIIVFRPKT